MGGEGSMLHAINSMKRNRALLKNKRSMNKKGKTTSYYSKTKLEFKKVSPAELSRLKEEIRATARKSRIRELLVTGIALLCVLGFLYWLIN